MRKLLSGFIVTAMASAAPAATIDVPNFSFENPAGPYALQVSLSIDNWTTTGPPGSAPGGEQVDVGNGPQNSGVGIFQNAHPGLAGYATNGDGSNLAYMFSGYTGTNAYKLHTLSQVLNTAAFTANTQYTLTAGVSDAGSPPSVDDQVSIQLFYTTTAAPNTPVFVATRNVVQGTDSLSSTALTDYSAVGSLGQLDPNLSTYKIGIMFTTSGPGGGEFNLDNVRLSASPVPEPASVTLFVAAAGLFRRRRENRR